MKYCQNIWQHRFDDLWLYQLVSYIDPLISFIKQWQRRNQGGVMKIKSAKFNRSARIIFCAMLLITLSMEASLALAQTRSRARRRPAVSNRVPLGTNLKIRLDDTIDTKSSRTGDRFRATVLTPSRYEEATIEGHLASVKQSGKFKGRTSLVLVFDRIRFTNGVTSPFRGQVVRIYGEDSVSKVDEEGRVESKKQGSSTTKRTVGGAVGGAIIGGIVGGGKGAAIGAAIGGGAGAGSMMISGSKKVKLESGTEMLIRATR
jgi:hypothetical protein